jgi:hypothetical protein
LKGRGTDFMEKARLARALLRISTAGLTWRSTLTNVYAVSPRIGGSI